MDGRAEAHQHRCEVCLVGGDAERVLVRYDPAVGTAPAVALVAPLDGLAPFLRLVEPEAPRIQADVASDGSGAPYHHARDHARHPGDQRVDGVGLGEVLQSDHGSDVSVREFRELRDSG